MDEISLCTECPICGRVTFIDVKEDDYFNWVHGELAQNAFPYLSITERESLISGLCKECQREVFGS